MSEKFTYDYPRPALAVDCVVGGFTRLGPQIVLIQRRNEPYKGEWALPGGFVDVAEDVEDAARREVLEETALEVEDLILVGVHGAPYRDPRERVVSISFAARIAPGRDPLLRSGDDAAKVGWFSVLHLPKLAFDHETIVLKAMSVLFPSGLDG